MEAMNYMPGDEYVMPKKGERGFELHMWINVKAPIILSLLVVVGAVIGSFWLIAVVSTLLFGFFVLAYFYETQRLSPRIGLGTMTLLSVLTMATALGLIWMLAP
jgi:hypothetical protein